MIALLAGTFELEKGVFTNESASAPGAITDKVQASLDLLNTEPRQREVQIVCDKRDDRFQMLYAIRTTDTNQDKIIHIAHVLFDLENPLDKMIERIEINQRVHLA